MLASAFVPDQLFEPVLMTGLLAETVPMWAVDVGEGALYSSLVAASLGGYLIAPDDSILKDSIGDAGIRTALSSTYRTYAAYRAQVDPDWQPGRFADLITSAVDPRNMRSAAFWTVLGVGAAVNVGFILLSAKDGQAVWDAGGASADGRIR